MKDALTSFWRRIRHRTEDEFASPADDPELRDLLLRSGMRAALAFFVLFGAVFFAFWWSGSAVRFGALRAAGAAAPTWRVEGIVRDSVTGEPVPWARVEDDPDGHPPLYFTEADQFGKFELLTLAEPHRVRISARGYRTGYAKVGRAWYLWLPRGAEHLQTQLVSDITTTRN